MLSLPPVAVVTGAGAGAARAIAVRLGREGWRVGLLSRNQDRLQAVGREIEAAGGQALVIPTDMTDTAAVNAARDQVLEAWGRIDVWVNAAMATVVSPISQMTVEDYQRVTETSFLGYVRGTLAALEPMRKANAGAIIQIGSALAYRAIPLQSAYCACKFAIRGFTDSLRAELDHEKSNIRLSMLQMPGMNTPQFDWAKVKLKNKYQPVGEVFDPEIAADAVWRAIHEAPRELWVGGSAIQAIVGEMAFPPLLDRIVGKSGFEQQISDVPETPGGGGARPAGPPPHPPPPRRAPRGRPRPVLRKSQAPRVHGQRHSRPAYSRDRGRAGRGGACGRSLRRRRDPRQGPRWVAQTMPAPG